MRTRLLASILATGLIVLSSGPAANAYTIDGDLSDWGVNPGTPQWVPNSGIYYVEEDYVGPGGFVDPGHGGQQNDAEAFYLDWDDTNLYIALVTGFPDSGWYDTEGGGYYIHAGDIGIDFGVNGLYTYAIEIGGHAPGYWGYNGTPGHVYTNISWDGSPTYPESDPLNIQNSGSPLDKGSGEFVYDHSYPSGDPDYDHWVVELSVPRSAFGADWDNYMKIHWTQSCGNDYIDVVTPEPMSMALFGSGLASIFFRIRRRKRP